MQDSIKTRQAQFYKHCSHTAKFGVAKKYFDNLIYAAASLFTVGLPTLWYFHRPKS